MFYDRNDHFAGLRRRWRLYAVLLACVVGIACLKPAALLAVNGYQQFISPYKGYRCAYGALYGGPSCSEFGKQAIREYGIVGGVILLRQRFRDCHDAAVAIRSGACRVGGPQASDVDENPCIETERERGKREARETCQYCFGCVEGCCPDQ